MRWMAERAPRRLGAVAAVCALCTLGAVQTMTATAVAAPIGDRSPGAIERTAADGGFGIVVRGDALLAGARVDGAVAVGGDLAFGADQQVAARSPGTFTAAGDARPTALLVGGAVDFTGSARQGVLRVRGDGYLKVGDLSGAAARTAATAPGAATTATRLVAAGAAYGSTPRIELTAAQPDASLAARGLVDLDRVFSAHRERADALAGCPGTVTLRDGRGAPLAEGAALAPGATVRVRPAADGTSVLRLSGRQLAAIGLLVFERRPTAANPVVVVVDTADTGSRLSWRTPALAGIGGADAASLLWSFGDARELTLAPGGGTLVGAVRAPRARFTDLSPSAMEGELVVGELSAGRLAGPAGPAVDAGSYRTVPFTARPVCAGGSGTGAAEQGAGTGTGSAVGGETGSGMGTGTGSGAGTGSAAGSGTGVSAASQGGVPGGGASPGGGTDPVPDGTDPVPNGTDPVPNGTDPVPDATGPAKGGPAPEPEVSQDVPLESAPESEGMELSPEPVTPEEGPEPAATPVPSSPPVAGGSKPGGPAADGDKGAEEAEGPAGAMADTGSRPVLWVVSGAAALFVSTGVALVTVARRNRRGLRG
ncbi:collagen-binding domain-containing protein [Streptomyces sp. NPDC046887]|uniref:collagen-binding domain-containing protein n=1 Tax=Streptomyces sp. NPDC046887 TaxID=3155472 RepID=UPI0033F67DF6